MIEYNPSAFNIIVKIYQADKDKKTTTKSGLITFNTFRPLMNSCGIGEVLAFGNLVVGVKKGDILLFHHNIEDMEERFLEKDEDGNEIRMVQQVPDGQEIFGVIRNDKNEVSRIIPAYGFVVAIPEEWMRHDKIINSIFQVTVKEVNAKDPTIKHMKLMSGEVVVVEPYGAYELSIDRNNFWFIHTDAIIAVNKGMHKINISRKRVSDTVRLGSTTERINLN